MSAAEPSRREDYTTIHLPPSARVLLATANEHKTREVRAILQDVLAPYGENALISLKGLPLPSPVEDGVNLLLTVEGRGIISDGRYLVNRVYDLGVNSARNYHTPYAQFTGTVVAID